ncbi:MAG: hypothetical protein MUQ30_10450 [Anaerolineae bacterium]|nr:hypothetical protein [Anaerolineae bacterium]
MTTKGSLIVGGSSLDLAHLQKLQRRPALCTPGEALFWDDPDISEQMLTAHLDPMSDAARATASHCVHTWPPVQAQPEVG